MKKIKINVIFVIGFFIAMTTFLGCDPYYDCTEVDTLTVFDDLRNVDSIEYFDSKLIVSENTFDTVYSEMTIFINDDSTYQALKNRTLSGANACSTCVFPNVDFSKASIIGRYFSLTCDEFSVPRFVATSDTTFAFYNKIYNMKQCESTTCKNATFNWMVVPKIQSLDQVEFLYGKYYYDCDC